MPRRKMPPPLPDPRTFGPGTPVILYLRESGGPKQEMSVAQQIYFIERNIIQVYGWTVYRVLTDEIKRGWDPGREGLNQLLDELRKRPVPFKIIIVWSYARLARERSIGYEIMFLKKRAGIPIFSCAPDEKPVSPEIDEKREAEFFEMAEAYSDKVSTDTRRGMATMIEKGYAPGGFPPVGYAVERVQIATHRDGTPRYWPRWVINPELRETVALAWKMGLEGAEKGSILARTLLFPNRSSLASFFKNPAYCGFPTWYLNYHKLQVAACVGRTPVVEPYVSIADWLRMQKGRGASPGSTVDPRREFGGQPLSGRITCGYCGAACHASAHVESRHCEECGEPWPSSKEKVCPSCGAPYSRRGGNYCYGCGAHHSRADRCPLSGYTAGRKLELALLREIAPHFTAGRLAEIVADINTALAAMHQGSDQQREAVQGKLREAEASVANLTEALDRGGWSEAVSARLRTREKDVATLRAELAMFAEPGPVPYIAAEDTQALADLFQDRILHLDRPERRRLFDGLDIHVRLYKKKAEASVQWPPLNLLLHLDQNRDPTSYYRLYPQPGTLTFYDGRCLFSAAA